MFFTLDIMSASVAFGLEMLLLWIGGIAPWTVLRKTWPVWIAAAGSTSYPWLCMARLRVGVGESRRIRGDLTQGSLYLATFLRVPGAVPGVMLALGLDPTDLADGLVLILHLPSKFVFGLICRPTHIPAPCCWMIGVRWGSPSLAADSATAM